MNCFKDPIKEIKTIREGINPELIENFLSDQSLVVKDTLKSLNIKPSTYFAKKKDHKRLDPTSTEKFLRLFSVFQITQDVLGHAEAKNWQGNSFFRRANSYGFTRYRGRAPPCRASIITNQIYGIYN